MITLTKEGFEQIIMRIYRRNLDLILHEYNALIWAQERKEALAQHGYIV